MFSVFNQGNWVFQNKRLERAMRWMVNRYNPSLWELIHWNMQKKIFSFLFFKEEYYLPGYCDAWELELLPEDSFTAYKLQTHTVQRLTNIPLWRLHSCLTVSIIYSLAFFLMRMLWCCPYIHLMDYFDSFFIREGFNTALSLCFLSSFSFDLIKFQQKFSLRLFFLMYFQSFSLLSLLKGF